MNNEQIALLKDLYCVHSPTGDEWALICYIRQYVQNNLPDVEIQMDSRGNLYFTKGTLAKGYPMLACHLDQVQQLHSHDFCVKQEDDRLYGWSQLNLFYSSPQ